MPATLTWLEPLTDVTVAAFLCILGANIGSFLNVVAHRLPRGESVVVGGSRCPACGGRIRWHDNVPVVGWLMLGGRCRACGAPISARYPVVEAAAAVIGVIVAVELLSGGRTWPIGRFGTGRSGADALLIHADWRFLVVCAIHATALLLLLFWTVAESDRMNLSWRSVGAVVVGLTSLSATAGGPTWPAGWRAVETAVLGAGVGIVVGLVIPNRWLRQALVIAGLVLGWRALLTAVAIMPIAGAARIFLGRNRALPLAAGPSCCDLAVGVGIQMLTWRWLDLVWFSG